MNNLKNHQAVDVYQKQLLLVSVNFDTSSQTCDNNEDHASRCEEHTTNLVLDLMHNNDDEHINVNENDTRIC